VDLDQDGHVDLLSGSWPGEIYLFRGDSRRHFGKPEMLKDRNGEIINPGGGVEEQDGMLMVTGYSEWKTDEKTKESYLLFRGRKYVGPDDLSLASTGCAIHAHAADWDADSDYDLILGDIAGSVYLIEKLRKRLGELSEESSGLREIIPQTQTRGWVWLFLRKKAG